MGREAIDVATLAALVATLVSLSCTWPQLARIRRTSDIAGVSAMAAALTVSSEVGWTLYLGGAGLWSAVPEGVVNIGANTLLVLAVVRSGGSVRSAVVVAVGWVTVLLAARSIGGPGALAALLGIAYAVQLTPAVFTAWRTWNPSGIATATWTLRLTEAALWGAYGYVRGDTPLVAFGVLGVIESTAILVRKAMTRHRPATVPVTLDDAFAARSQLLDDAVVG